MSKESYARGFCKAAAAAGVDPVALAKYAGEIVSNTDAGIGSYRENSSDSNYSEKREVPYNARSYIGRLLARHPGFYKDVAIPRLGSSSMVPISPKSLESSRAWQADSNARSFYPKGSAPYRRILDNLINAGKENHKSYLETGDTKERTEPDLKGIEKLKLTPEQKKLLIQMQNTMVRNGAPRQMNIA